MTRGFHVCDELPGLGPISEKQKWLIAMQQGTKSGYGYTLVDVARLSRSVRRIVAQKQFTNHKRLAKAW